MPMKTSQENTTFSNLHPCLPGTQILSLPLINSYVIELRQLISAPNDIYKELYLPTLCNFMELCQAMPADIQNPIPYSLLTRRLELAIAALKLRRGHMLPQHSNSETVAEQEPLWTYALFTTSLLVNINHIQSDRTIDLYQDKNKKLGIWHPMVGSLYEVGTCYTILPQAPQLKVEAPTLQTALLGKIIPGVGMRWLVSYPEVFPLWIEAVTGKAAINNPLMQPVLEAAQKIDFPLVENLTITENWEHSIPSPTTPANLPPILMEWIAQQADSENKSPSFLRLSEGLFITTAALTAFIAQSATTLSLNALLKELDSVLLKEDEKLFFEYRSINFENRQILEGVIISQEYLNDTLKAYSVRTDFIPNTFL